MGTHGKQVRLIVTITILFFFGGMLAQEEQPHWSFQPVKRPAVPDVSDNPVDSFLDARLKKAGVKSNDPADVHDLVRRLSTLCSCACGSECHV